MKRLSDYFSFKLERELVEKAKRLAKQRFPLRKIDKNSEAIREIIILFIKEHTELDKKENVEVKI